MFDFDEKTVDDIPVVILDTETTGLHTALGHRVIEIGAIRLEKGRQVGEFQTLLNPGRPIEQQASEITGIVDDDVANAPIFADVVDELDRFLESSLLVAHNATFDADFMGNEYNLIERSLENPWVCTFKLARQYFHFGRNNLANIAGRLNIPMTKAHRALNDVIVTTEVFRRMNRELVQKHKCKTVGDLLYAQGGAIYSPSRQNVILPPLLAEALATKQDINIRYVSKVGTINSRRVTPRYATQNGKTGYFIAYCHLRKQQRTFRIDRIMGVEFASGS
ncbi:MAG: DNA polymerase III epsilon subunit [Cellvibrionaceae bacterium]|jgi:DNA polymerase III epsilon subunit